MSDEKYPDSGMLEKLKGFTIGYEDYQIFWNIEWGVGKRDYPGNPASPYIVEKWFGTLEAALDYVIKETE